ncbi:MAG TPA: aminotransferase class III-fold pyridoxal phosphate-dependent enzyme, partial [Terriglobales bacterium]
MGVIELKTSVPGPNSKTLAARREAVVPRGLSHATPVYVAHAQGACLEDVDGNRFLDFAGGIGSLNSGHRNAHVVAQLESQLQNFLHACAS